MALSHPRRGLFAAFLAALSLAIGQVHAVAAEPVVFQPDEPASFSQARKQGKLLLAVHLSGDSEQNDLEGDETKLYRDITLRDERIENLLAERYIVVGRQVGAPVQPEPRKKVDRDSRRPPFAITYVCLPDGRVLHFIPGYLSSSELLAELQWVERTYAGMIERPAYEQAAFVREAHQTAAGEHGLRHFQRQFTSRWTGGSEPPSSTVDLPDAAAAAAKALELSLKQQLGAAASGKQGAMRIQSMAEHGRVASRYSHLLLAEFPLVALDDLAGCAYEAYSGEKFGPWGNRSGENQ